MAGAKSKPSLAVVLAGMPGMSGKGGGEKPHGDEENDSADMKPSDEEFEEKALAAFPEWSEADDKDERITALKGFFKLCMEGC